MTHLHLTRRGVQPGATTQLPQISAAPQRPVINPSVQRKVA